MRFETIVVDNGSVDGSPEMVTHDFPTVRLITNPDNRGFARANNQAIGVSSGRHALLLNSDAVLVGDTAQTMVRFLDAHPRAGMVGAKLLNPDGSFQASYNDFPGLRHEFLVLSGLARWFLPSTYPSYPEARSRERRSVDWIGGACLMVRRQAFETVGLLDEDYFMYAEEMDWCYRMKRGGWDICYLPEARAVHGSGASSRRAPEFKRAQLYRGKWLFLRKHQGLPRAEAFRLLVQVLSFVKLLRWLPSRLSANLARREQARAQIASYRFVLTSFSGRVARGGQP